MLYMALTLYMSWTEPIMFITLCVNFTGDGGKKVWNPHFLELDHDFFGIKKKKNVIKRFE